MESRLGFIFLCICSVATPLPRPQTLQGGFTRCVSVLSQSSKPEDMAVQVCTHICRCFRVSAHFEACREAIVEVPAIIKDICRVLYYKVGVV